MIAHLVTRWQPSSCGRSQANPWRIIAPVREGSCRGAGTADTAPRPPAVSRSAPSSPEQYVAVILDDEIHAPRADDDAVVGDEDLHLALEDEAGLAANPFVPFASFRVFVIQTLRALVLQRLPVTLPTHTPPP